MRLTDDGTEQAGGFAWFCKADMEQLKFKVPVNPELVREKLPLVLAPGATVMEPLLNEKTCCGTRMAGAFVEVEGAFFASPA